MNCIVAKLESTFLGNGAGAADGAPQGILYNKTATAIDTYAELCDFEAGLENQDIYAEARYIVSPKAKAFWRSAIKGTNCTGMVLENDQIDGTPAISTTYMGADGKKMLYGVFQDNVVICQWGGLDLTLDTVTQATKGCIRIVINAYYDVLVKRPEALLLAEVGAGEPPIDPSVG